MKKTKNDQSNKNSNSILGPKTSSMLGLTTNEDFNNARPAHNDIGLTKGISDGNDKKVRKNINPPVDKKIVEAKNKKK